MKNLRFALRLSSLFRTPMPSFKPVLNYQTKALGGFALGYGFWFGSQKILNDEVSTF